MSTNIIYSEYISGQLTINARTVRVLKKKFKSNLPGGCFLHEINDEEGDVVIESPQWYSEGSGHAYCDCINEVLSNTKGHAVIVFTWEGVNPQTAKEVKDGVVKDKKVKITVEDE